MRVFALLAVALLGAAGAARAQEAPAGMAVYQEWCAGCHGAEGAADGPAADYMLPRPRDFTMGLYEIRTTPSGALPTDEDILRIIDEGMPGTAMPGWKDKLSKSDRDALVEVLKSFAPFFESAEVPEPIEIGEAPSASEEALAEGREFYERIECNKCHGDKGRGDGPSAPSLEDDRDLPVRSADLTENWLFNGGGSTEAIFTRLMTGLNGTPMPSFADLIDAEFMTEEQLWNVALYVRSLAPEEPPVVREVVRAARVEGELPDAVDDEAWDGVEAFYVPLVGQVIVEPRWFAPRVDGVWIQALHDGETLALRATWHDPSESPDPAWAEWWQRVVPIMAPNGSGPAGTTGAEEAGEATPAGDPGEAAAEPPRPEGAATAGPDMLVVQWPTTIPEGMERPYFLMGDEDDPVYLWHWRSEGASEEELARGLARWEPLDGAEDLEVDAVFDAGEWRVLFRRPIQSGGVENRLTFESGRAIPMALFAWDGDNGESGTRGAVSTWYFLYLDQPTASTTYVFPVLAALLTAGLGVVVVARAQRRSGGRREERDEARERERTTKSDES